MTNRKAPGFPVAGAASTPATLLTASAALLPAIAAASLGAGALHDATRWLAWVMLAPLFAAKHRPAFGWTTFALLLNSYFLLPYQSAIELELANQTQANLFYLAIVALTIMPYGMLDLAETHMHRLGCNMEVRIAFLAIAIWAIWLATDQILATKYWYALALDPAPLWLARVAGEEGLAAAMIGTSAALAWASRQTHGYRVLAWGGVTGMGGWLCLGNPLTDEPRSWPGIDVLAIQPGIHDSASSRDQTEALQLLTGMSTAHGRGLTPGLILLPELMAIPLDDGSPYLSPYLMASRRYRADILINGARPVGAAVFERSASLVVDGALQSDSVPKRRLIPHYESLRGPQGSRWVAGNGDAPRMLNSANGRIAPLLCFEIFDRSALRGLQANSALVAVAADTSSFGHPALSRYVVHAAAFQSQAARAPVVLTNYSGPSAVVFPNGERHKVLERGATGYFRISPGGDVEMQEFRLWKPP